MRRKRAADCMGFGHDASEPCFTVSTLGNIKIRHLGESESVNFLATFQCARLTVDLTNRANYL